MEFTLLWAVLTAAALGRLAIWRTKPPPETGDILVGSATTGLVVGRLAAMIGDGVNPLTNPADIIIIRAGVDTGFATLAALPMLARLSRLDGKLLDQAAPVALAALAGWHGGCLWRSTCLGAASDLPWAYPQAGSSIDRHPVELYAALLFIGGAWLVRHPIRSPGVAAGLALSLAAAIRLSTQPLRPSLTGGPVGWYVAGLFAGLVWAGFSTRSRPGERSEGDPDPAAGAVPDLDPSAARFDDSLGDGQTEPGPSPGT